MNTDFSLELSGHAAPTLSDAALTELATFGEETAVEVGDVLYRAGDESYDFVVLLEGAVDIIRPDLDGEMLITTHRAGRFLGELNMVTGQRSYLTARVSERGRVLRIPNEEFHQIMNRKPELADTIFSAFVTASRDLTIWRRCTGGQNHWFPVLERCHGAQSVCCQVSVSAHLDRYRG